MLHSPIGLLTRQVQDNDSYLFLFLLLSVDVLAGNPAHLAQRGRCPNRQCTRRLPCEPRKPRIFLRK